MKAEKIFIGGWYQRTTLHLSEIYDFLKGDDSPLDLSKEKLKSLRDKLELETVVMRATEFEHINVENKQGIMVRIFEDGLIVLNKDFKNAKEDIAELTDFYENKLSPGLGYIFSLGAPVPKELANIKTVYPYFIVLNKAEPTEIENLLKEFNQSKYSEIKKKEFEIYRGNKLYVINNIKEDANVIERLINEQIFVREFKGQLHRYLNLHRIIWEKIAAIKERGKISGKEVGPLKGQLESYEKTINLISSRINQMGVYVGTRGAIVKNDPDLKRITSILQFKYETLTNTLAYVKEIWTMTRNYVNSSLDLFSGIQAKSTESSIKNLTVITTAGVAGTLLGLFTKKMPTFTLDSLIYFCILVFIGYSANKIMKTVAIRRKYEIKDVEIDRNIG
ncbi:hypothetical protein K8R32_01805 [bacterium]|nr:hypothetical protein [bacterium]